MLMVCAMILNMLTQKICASLDNVLVIRGSKDGAYLH